jgi:hypothetical protein
LGKEKTMLNNVLKQALRAADRKAADAQEALLKGRPDRADHPLFLSLAEAQKELDKAYARFAGLPIQAS